MRHLFRWVLLGLTVLLPTFVSAQPKKMALLVGIDAYKELPLVGCEKDVRNMRELLLNQGGFAAANISLLLNKAATRKGIIDRIKAKVAQAERGDLFVFYYSGHGARFPDEKSEEWDELKPGQLNSPMFKDEGLRFGLNIGLDSALCPVDVGEPSTSGKPWENLILDDELYLLFSPLVQKGCAVVLIVDSCHSGTVLMRGKIKPNAPPPPPRLMKEFPIRKALTKPLQEIPQTPVVRTVHNHYASGLYLALTASRDTEFSGATENGSLYTNALIAAMKQNPRLSYQALYQKVKTRVWDQTDREQDPQLDQRFFSGNLKGRFLALPDALPATVMALPLRLRLQVTNMQGQSVMNPTIAITTLNDPAVSATGVTFRQGRYLTDTILPQGEYRIKVTHPDYQSIETTVSLVDVNLNSGWAEYWVRMTPIARFPRRPVDRLRIQPRIETNKIIRKPGNLIR